MWEIRRYQSGMKKEWDLFVDKARNSTFLFRRSFIDYHGERFADHSLIAYRNGKLAAILPANISEGMLWSHQGLTYGGWVWAPGGPDTSEVFLLWKEWLQYCRDEKIEKIIYKPLPYIYASMPSQEDLYMLFLSGSSYVATEMSTTIDLSDNPGFNTLQKRHLRKASRANLHIEKFDGLNPDKIDKFHALLTGCLRDRHGASPVHSAQELRKLACDNQEIKFWSVESLNNREMLGGVCVFETKKCAHCQYIATSEEGRAENVLALLFDKLIRHYTDCAFRYFDFGISNEGGGIILNSGLNRQKTAYGGSGVACSRYIIDVSSALESLPNELWPPK